MHDAVPCIPNERHLTPPYIQKMIYRNSRHVLGDMIIRLHVQAEDGIDVPKAIYHDDSFI